MRDEVRVINGRKVEYIYALIESCEEKLIKQKLPSWVFNQWKACFHKNEKSANRGYISYSYLTEFFDFSKIDGKSKDNGYQSKARMHTSLCKLIAVSKAWLEVMGSNTDEEFCLAMEWSGLERTVVHQEIIIENNREHARSMGKKSVLMNKEKKEALHKKIALDAIERLKREEPPHEIASKLSKIYDLCPKQIRNILAKYESLNEIKIAKKAMSDREYIAHLEYIKKLIKGNQP